MTILLSDLSKSATTRILGSLQHILGKAEAHAAEKGIEETVLLNWRLAPDMFPMRRQVQIVTDQSTRGLARLAGAEIPSREDNEESFADLKERVSWAAAFIKDVDDTALDADPNGIVEFPVGREETMSLPRASYFNLFILPNVYFHVTTAYGLLRSAGVPLGKKDYLHG